ncbi:MAG: HK97 family phage prohead protease [Alphaproteobacteria bacterium]|nr:HK97 family phage prohead protease [Alphaproteobacteria bacterium]
MDEAVLIEGYASIFGAADLAGDVVRPGAFTRSLAKGGEVPMLFQHVSGRAAGSWTTIREDGRGLFVRGLVTTTTAAGRAARKMIAEQGLDGLSIGFIARDWRPRIGGGRELREIELREVSLVSTPMAPAARFRASGPARQIVLAA